MKTFKIVTQVVKTYYVEYSGSNGTIYAGPFDTREEALAAYKQANRENSVSVTRKPTEKAEPA